MNKIISIISSVILFLLSLIGLYAYAKKRGKDEEKSENAKEVINDVVSVKKQEDIVNAMSTGAVRDGLREFTRN